jgi:hypothetical protein
MTSATDAPTPGEPTVPEPGDTCRFEEDGVRCTADLDDGEGYDGYCGSHADRLEAAGHWS